MLYGMVHRERYVAKEGCHHSHAQFSTTLTTRYQDYSRLKEGLGYHFLAFAVGKLSNAARSG
jgi:hypothetical protein